MALSPAERAVKAIKSRYADQTEREIAIEGAVCLVQSLSDWGEGIRSRVDADECRDELQRLSAHLKYEKTP